MRLLRRDSVRRDEGRDHLIPNELDAVCAGGLKALLRSRLRKMLGERQLLAGATISMMMVAVAAIGLTIITMVMVMVMATAKTNLVEALGRKPHEPGEHLQRRPFS